MSIEAPCTDKGEYGNKRYYAEIASVPFGVEEPFVGESISDAHLGLGNCEFGVVYFPEPVNPDFRNPTVESPMSGAEFLSYLDISGIGEELEGFYQSPGHYRLPIEAMVKTMVFRRMMGLRSESHLVSRLKCYPFVAEHLGFRQNTDGFVVPSRFAFHHFVNERLGLSGLIRVHGFLLEMLVDECRRRGIDLGRRIGVDSTPLEALRRDRGALYNGHYEKWMYKVHELTCLDTGVSLTCLVTDANEYDGHFLIPMLNKIWRKGIRFEEVYGDTHYSTIPNWAKVNIDYDAKCVFNVGVRDVLHDEGRSEYILSLYNKHWQDPDYQKKAGFPYILRFLYDKGHWKNVAHYHRNRWIWEWVKGKDARVKYRDRTEVERKHSHFKNSLLLEKNLDVEHQHEIKKYVLEFWITELAIALTRVQNGVTTGLTDCNKTIFV